MFANARSTFLRPLFRSPLCSPFLRPLQTKSMRPSSSSSKIDKQIYPTILLTELPSTSQSRTHAASTTTHLKQLLSAPKSTDASIHIRDLLTLAITPPGTPTSRKNAPAILPRGTAVLINFGHVKAITWSSRALLFSPHKPAIQLLSSHLNTLLSDRHASGVDHVEADSEDYFELVLLEEVLRDVCDTWHRRCKLYSPVVEGVLKVSGS